MAFIFKKRLSGGNDVADNNANVPKLKAAEIYVGIDFGTTFTKVSFQIGGKEGATKYSIRFFDFDGEEAYCLPSKLGYDKSSDELVFTPTAIDKGIEEVKYFKYSMIEKGVPRHDNLDKRAALDNDPQRLCSAFYLAHVISMIKETISAHPAVSGRFETLRWYINMGVPVSDFNAKPKPIYDEALNVAWQLVEGGELSPRMKLTHLDGLYSRGVNHDSWCNRLNTVPELYAELIMFLQNKAVDTGFYSVIDIGGGTVDLAVFFKRIDLYSKKVEISCVAQEVCPLGYEMYKEVLGEEKAYKRMHESYGTVISNAYLNHRSDMRKAKQNGNPLIHFYMGGAGKVQFYHDAVDYMINVHIRSWSECYPGAAEKDMISFMKNKQDLEVDDNPRLIISQMLAQPFEMMPELSGKPWNFEKQAKGLSAPSLSDLQDSLYGI